METQKYKKETVLSMKQKEKNIIAFFDAQDHELLQKSGLYFWAHLYEDDFAYQYCKKAYVDLVGYTNIAEKVKDDIYKIKIALKSNTENKDIYDMGISISEEEYAGFKKAENKSFLEVDKIILNSINKKVVCLSTQGYAILDDSQGRPLISVGTNRDISKEENKDKLIEELTQIAYFDNLTGLPNRRRLIEDEKREDFVCDYFGFIDLNKFKTINDTYGHSFGDKCLIEFSEQVKEKLKNKSIKFSKVYRMHGDEFCAAIKIAEGYTIEEVMEEFLKDSHKFSIVGGIAVKMTASFGLAKINKNIKRDLKFILEVADEAMYIAKAQKKDYHILTMDI